MKTFEDFLSTFNINKERIIKTKSFRKYLKDCGFKSIEELSYIDDLPLIFDFWVIYDFLDELGVNFVQFEYTDEGEIYNYTFKSGDKFYTMRLKWRDYHDNMFRFCGIDEVFPKTTIRYE